MNVMSDFLDKYSGQHLLNYSLFVSLISTSLSVH